jgi:predicted site-specific integrase-resolvase
MKKTYSTAQVLKLLGVGPETLYRWMRERKIPVPAIQSLAGMRVRLWSEHQLDQAKKYKAEHYWGKGGRRTKKAKK